MNKFSEIEPLEWVLQLMPELNAPVSLSNGEVIENPRQFLRAAKRRLNRRRSSQR